MGVCGGPRGSARSVGIRGGLWASVGVSGRILVAAFRSSSSYTGFRNTATPYLNKLLKIASAIITSFSFGTLFLILHQFFENDI